MGEKASGLYKIKEDKSDFLVLEIPKRRKIIGYVFFTFVLFLLLSGSRLAFHSDSIAVGILLLLAGFGIIYLVLKKLYIAHHKIIVDGRKKTIIWTGGKRKDEYLDFDRIKEIEFFKQRVMLRGGPESPDSERIMYSVFVIRQDGTKFEVNYSHDENYIKNLAEKISKITRKDMKS